MTNPSGGEPPDVVSLGKSRRVLLCVLTVEDKRALDETIHMLMDRETEVDEQRDRVTKVLRQRLAKLVDRRLELHKTWTAGEEKRLIEVEVFRDNRRGPGEIVVVRLDTGKELSRRPLSKSEQLELYKDANTPDYVEELDLDDGVEAFAKKHYDHEAEVQKLLEMVDIPTLMEELETVAAAGSDKPATPAAPEDDKPRPAATPPAAANDGGGDGQGQAAPAKKGRGGGRKKGAGPAKKTATPKRTRKKPAAATSARRPPITDDDDDEGDGEGDETREGSDDE